MGRLGHSQGVFSTEEHRGLKSKTTELEMELQEGKELEARKKQV